MFLKKLFRKKDNYPSGTKYKKGDFINFRYRNELYFGYVYMAYVDSYGKVTYTIQIGGQCPTFIYDYKEEDIIGLKK